jgi:hypothetical protein
MLFGDVRKAKERQFWHDIEFVDDASPPRTSVLGEGRGARRQRPLGAAAATAVIRTKQNSYALPKSFRIDPQSTIAAEPPARMLKFAPTQTAASCQDGSRCNSCKCVPSHR